MPTEHTTTVVELTRFCFSTSDCFLNKFETKIAVFVVALEKPTFRKFSKKKKLRSTGVESNRIESVEEKFVNTRIGFIGIVQRRFVVVRLVHGFWFE